MHLGGRPAHDVPGVGGVVREPFAKFVLIDPEGEGVDVAPLPLLASAVFHQAVIALEAQEGERVARPDVAAHGGVVVRGGVDMSAALTTRRSSQA